MESDEIRRALQEADRAEASPWIDYPPTPRWYPVAVGVWAALITLAFTELDEPLRLPAVLLLIVLEGGFLGWYVRYRGGVMPTGPAPREFRRSIVLFVLGAVGILVGIALLASFVSPWLAAAFALVTTTVLIAWYERVYAEAARRARERLT